MSTEHEDETAKGNTMNLQTLVDTVTDQIQGQNWTDRDLTDGERTVIDMAVRATVYELQQGEGSTKLAKAKEQKVK